MYRTLLAGTTLILGVATTATGQSATLPLPGTLRAAVGDRMLIGTAIMAQDLQDPRHADLITREFNCLTGGNEFKPDALQKMKGTFTFEKADQLVAFAKRHDMKVVGHTLLWHNQSPAWLFQNADGEPLPREAALANLKDHVAAVIQHFGNDVVGWDVLNEGITDGDDGYLRDTPARKAIGDDYVVQAFKIAHEANPNVELYYNDYNIENPGKRERALKLIRELKAAGVRLDAVGIQGHWLINFPDAQVLDDAITEFAAEGVEVMITEMDIDVLPRRSTGADITLREAGADPYKEGLPADVQQKLAERYKAFFDVIVKHAADGVVTRVSLWGTTDDHTWLNNFPVRGRTNHPLLFDRNFAPKPAHAAVLESLKSLGGASAQN